jgi:hypothetical protein
MYLLVYTVAKVEQFSIHGLKGAPLIVNFVDVGKFSMHTRSYHIASSYGMCSSAVLLLGQPASFSYWLWGQLLRYSYWL